jgi:hypothetical protein
MEKKELRSLLAEGKTKQVLAKLIGLTADNSDLHNELILISAQFEKNDRISRLNIQDPKEVKIENNRIISVLIDVIDKLPEKPVRKIEKRKLTSIALWVGMILAVVVITVYALKIFNNNNIISIQDQKKESEEGNINLKTIDSKNSNPKGGVTDTTDKKYFHDTLSHRTLQSIGSKTNLEVIERPKKQRLRPIKFYPDDIGFIFDIIIKNDVEYYPDGNNGYFANPLYKGDKLIFKNRTTNQEHEINF